MSEPSLLDCTCISLLDVSLDLLVLSGFPFMEGENVSTISLFFIRYLDQDHDGPESTRHLENKLVAL
jgi:hypothetical protein